MCRYGVPFLAEPSVDEDSLYEDLARNIITVIGDGCEGDYSVEKEAQ